MMNADTLTMLFREGDVEANDSFQRQFSPSCNFQNVLWKFVDSARSLVRKILIFGVLVSFCVANAALVALSLSHVPWLVGVVSTSGHLDHANALFCTARQLSTDLESPDISCRQENSPLVTRSHFFVVTAFSV